MSVAGVLALVIGRKGWIPVEGSCCQLFPTLLTLHLLNFSMLPECQGVEWIVRR